MLLTSAIYEQILAGNIICNPMPFEMGANSIDVRLGTHFWRLCGWNEGKPQYEYFRRAMGELVTFEWGEFYLGCTIEIIGTRPGSGLVPLIHQRSTPARMGFDIAGAAGFGDEGFASIWTIEISARSRHGAHWTVGEPIAQVEFAVGDGCANAYKGQYGQGEWSPLDMLPKAVREAHRGQVK